MVFLDNVRLFFRDHPEIYGEDPMIPFAELLAAVSPDAMDREVSPTEDFESFVKTTVITSGEVKHFLGEEQFKTFSADLELPQHRTILLRAVTR